MAATKVIPTQKSVKLIDGKFDKRDALDIVTRLFHTKIKFHEDRISHLHNEEDIKMRETRIKNLQGELFHIKEFIDKNPDNLSLSTIISLEIKE
jgi:hypothetical protein